MTGFDPRAWLFARRGWITGMGAGSVLLWAHPTLTSLLLGGACCAMGEGLRLWAIGHTGAHTRKHAVQAPVLVTAGPYSLVRHPLYLGNCFNALGVFTAASGAHPSGVGVLGLLGYLLLLYGSLVSLEEDFLLRKFGAEYRDYSARVPQLWPRAWRPGPGNGSFSWGQMRYEATTLGWLVLIWTWLLAHV